MKIVIDIPAKDFEKVKCGRGAVSMMRKAIIHGAPLPEGAEILTKEAYSDLCTRAAEQSEERTEERTESHACDCISRQAAEEKLKKVVDEMALIFSDIREKNVDDSVCGLCEYDCDHGIDGCANECPGFERDDCFKLKEEYRKEWTDLSDIPSVEPERKTGKWEYVQYDGNPKIGNWHCSECRSIVLGFEYTGFYNYCPWCGAPMEEDLV